MRVAISMRMHRLENGDVELAASTEFGPRVLEYRRRGGENVFGRVPETQGVETPFGTWHSRGGHRLWHAPEDRVRTYYPDNAPVAVRGGTHMVVLTQAVEPHTLLEKEIALELATSGTRVRVTHRIRNRGGFDVELALWAISVMRPGGCAFIAQPKYVSHDVELAPARPIVTWPFTQMDDPRFAWGARFIRLRQDPSRSEPEKIGAYDRAGFVAYASGEDLFVKRHEPQPGAHVDFGCNVELWVDSGILEAETLSPIVRIPPGGEAQHVEVWSLARCDEDLSHASDDVVAAAIDQACVK
ncbi:MAG TPA: hypothetical protein VGH28_28220 [Polyangiaceae bacterium]|jgi:hypothetical protein